MRDTAIGGLAALLNRQVWRESDALATIKHSVISAMADPNPVVRMRAAEGARAALRDETPDERARIIGDLLLAEESPTARVILLDQLAPDSATVPEVVDAILERLSNGEEPDISDVHSDPQRSVLQLLTHLALVFRTPYASRTIEGWCQNAPRKAAAVQAFAGFARSYLGPLPGAGQREAFRLLAVAIDASLSRWTRDPSERRAADDLPNEQRAELQNAAEVAHRIAQEIYFASGAFDEKQGKQRLESADLQAFADLAFPTLAACAEFQIPRCVAEAVNTMIFLAPTDEARALKAIATAVPAAGPYASDSLAAADVVPYLERLLTEQRQLVLFDQDGVVSFRHLLSTFASAGNQEALVRAYNFADVFR